MTALLQTVNIAAKPIQKGDAGIILRVDGSFELFNTHENIGKDGELTDRQLEQGAILLGLSAALRVPGIMDTLIQMAGDKEVFSDVVDTKGGH
jgi:hypothetical protein